MPGCFSSTTFSDFFPFKPWLNFFSHTHCWPLKNCTYACKIKQFCRPRAVECYYYCKMVILKSSIGADKHLDILSNLYSEFSSTCFCVFSFGKMTVDDYQLAKSTKCTPLREMMRFSVDWTHASTLPKRGSVFSSRHISKSSPKKLFRVNISF